MASCWMQAMSRCIERGRWILMGSSPGSRTTVGDRVTTRRSRDSMQHPQSPQSWAACLSANCSPRCRLLLTRLRGNRFRRGGPAAARPSRITEPNQSVARRIRAHQPAPAPPPVGSAPRRLLRVMRMMRVVVVVVMVPMVRRVRKAGTRKQTQRNRDSDELGHVSDPNLRDSEFPEAISITSRGARRESSGACSLGFRA
jgi:hypothetical protein